MDYGKVATVLNRTKDSIYAHYKNEFKNNPGAIADALDLEDYAGWSIFDSNIFNADTGQVLQWSGTMIERSHLIMSRRRNELNDG